MSQAEFKDDTVDSQLRQKTSTLPQQQQQSLAVDLDQALCLFAKTKISERRPRMSTGNVSCTKEGSTIVAKSSDNLATIMEICSVESILGMGVIDEANDNRCVGMIDIPGISRYLLQNCLKDCTPSTLQTHLTSQCCSTIQQCMSTTTVMDVIRWLDENHCCPLECSPASSSSSSSSAAATTTSTDTTNTTDNNKQKDTKIPHVNPFCSSLVIPEGHSLLFAMEMLCNNGVKRVVTVDKDQRCTGFYSTSMAISDIRQQAHLLRSFTQRSVQSCLDYCHATHSHRRGGVEEDSAVLDTSQPRMSDNETASRCVISLPITATAFEAFTLMIRDNITGIALLDTAGKLTGTISIRDLRGLGKRFEHLDRLSLSLKDFKALCLKEFPQIAPPTHWASDSKVPSGCRYVEESRGTMRDVLLALNDGNLNRVMIMDDAGTLTGIITLHDVIRFSLHCMNVLE